ncbi:MAG TPA: N-acetyltransferase [Bryobacteraceae bacterium]|nr:N-acetyltransferase [Bryobacteraceae bacterium]
MTTAPVQVSVRKAAMRDIPNILALINSYAAGGIMLPRTEFEMSENIRDFSVAYDSETLAGCGALHFYTPTTAEVRSLAVLPEMKQHGIGRVIVEALEAEARENELDAIFAFTYVPGFFQKLGFGEVERGELPLKVWKDCLRCPKFQNCDEIAVLKRLRNVGNLSFSRRRPASAADHLVQLPQVAASVNR